MGRLTVILLSCLMAAGCATTTSALPNFVFILVDDLGYRDTEPYHPETFYETPHIQRLADAGMRFTQGYTSSPVCSPTRYSLLTGRYPARAGLTDWLVGTREGRFRPAPLNDRMPLEEVTLAEALQEAGYATLYAGKWHLGPTEEFWPEHQGFDINRGGFSAGYPRGPGHYFPPYDNPRLEDGPPGEHLPDRLATEVVEFIEQNVQRERPFLAYLAFYSVHTPLIGRPDLVDKYEEKARGLGLPKEGTFMEEEQVWPTDDPRLVRAIQSLPVYGAMVEAMDQAVGKVVDALERTGISNNTVVVFTSDNGGLSSAEGSPTSNLPLRGGKGWLYEGGIRVPVIVHWPGHTEPGTVCTVPITSTDFYPTLLDIAGLQRREAQHLDGVSLVPLLKGGDALGREALFWHYPHYSNQGGFPGGALRQGPWKLIQRFEDNRFQLFNLEDDPGERIELVEAEPDRVREMKERLLDWQQQVGARFLRPREDGGAAK